MDFTFDEYYSRHFPLIGKENQRRLSKRSVLIAGVGGLGTTAANLLASMGVGHLVLVDYDVIEQSNLPRQELYTLGDVGAAKVDIAREFLIRRNPSVRVTTHTISIDGLSVKEILDGVDLVVDGLDSFSPRRSLHSAAYERRIPYIFAGAVSLHGNVMSFTFRENKPCMVCVLGYPEDNNENTCAVLGVHPSILSIIASIQVSEVIRILLDQKAELEEQMMYVDLESLDFEKIKFKKRENCPECKRIEQGLEVGKEGEVRREKLSISDLGTVNLSSLCGKDTYIFTPTFSWEYDIHKIREILDEYWSVNFKGSSVLVIHARGATCSLMKSGVMTIRGAGTKKFATRLYTDILEILKSLWSTT